MEKQAQKIKKQKNPGRAEKKISSMKKERKAILDVLTTKIQNGEIKKRLRSAFLGIVIFTSVILVLLLAGMTRIYSSLITFYNEPYQMVSISKQMKSDINQLQSVIYKAALETDAQKITASVSAARRIDKKIAPIPKQLNDMAVDEKMDEGTKRLQTYVDQLTAAEEKVYTSLLQNDTEDAMTTVSGDLSKAINSITFELDLTSTISSQQAQIHIDSAKHTMLFLIILVACVILFTIFAIITIIKKTTISIIKPLTEVESTVRELAKGNLNVEISYSGNDELGKLSDNLRVTISELKKYVTNIREVLKQLENKDMTASVNIEYMGDFAPIKSSMEEIAASFNDVIKKIQSSAGQVAEGADQIAGASQTLAEGATEQSSAVEELYATINEVVEHVNHNAENASYVSNLSQKAVSAAERGNEHMKQLLNAMGSINEQANEISKIIQVIDNIASQTNLLSLNASIEAARAGEHGAGFAVVASEIGKLANECSAAARTTTELIENCINAVTEGSSLTDETAEVLNHVVDTSAETSKLVGDITEASNRQSEYLKEVLQGVQQIASVVESNSATAEETSASSQELQSQADMLEGLLNTFTIS